jgi:glutathione S-transferase
MSQEGKVVLGYWDIRGLAERIRHLLEYTGLTYDQVFYAESKEDQWFQVDKPKLLEKNPAINLPYLIDGDKVISESAAICVYICHRSNRLDLLGRNAEEQVLLATTYGVLKDFSPQYINLVYGEYTEPTWEEALKNYSLKF